MAVSQDRAAILEATQLGVESVPGALVAALKRLTSVYVEPVPNITIAMHRAMGSFVATSEVMQKEWTAANLSSTDFSFRELIYLLAGVVGAPVGGGPIIPSGATNTRRWTFRLINWTATNPQTYTFEHGQNINGFAERFGYGLINTLACRTTDTDLAFSGQVIGQQLIEAVTITQGGAALANPTNAPVLTATGMANSSPIADPTTGPSGTAVGTGGTLAAGAYSFAYTYINAAGETKASPAASFVTVVANGSITVAAVTPLETGATGVKWYVSDGPGSYTFRLVPTAPSTGATWTITAAPANTQPIPPTVNTTASGGTTSFAAGVYTGGYTLKDTTGETADITSTVTILAGQSITFAPITGVPAGATVKYYLSPAAGNSSIQTTGVQNSGQSSQVFTTLPGVSAGAPPAVSTTQPTSITQLQDTPADPSKIAVWSGNSIAALAQHARAFDSEWSISNRFGTIMTQDDRTNTYSGHVDKAPDISVTTTLEHDATSQGLMADLRAKTPKYLRWIVSGALIEAGFPFRCQMTMPAFLDKPTRKAQGDVYGASYDWVARDDPSFGAIIEFIVDTDQAAL